jgi:hypothetical protein
MIRISRKNEIELLDDIKIDFNLPKHKKPKASNVVNGNNSIFITTTNISVDVSEEPASWEIEPKLSWWGRLIHRLKKSDPTKTFQLILNDPTELNIFKDKIEAYKALIEKANSNGQTALAESITDKIKVILLEDKLVLAEFKKIVPETLMVQFVKDYKKVLEITYIKNYVREIPDDVIALKKKADELNVFDNYVILHTNPTATKDTKREVAAKKDPILFGLIKDSRKFYYIGSWIDELCDLTFDAFIEKYGNKQLEMREQIPLAQPLKEILAKETKLDEMLKKVKFTGKEDVVGLPPPEENPITKNQIDANIDSSEKDTTND